MSFSSSSTNRVELLETRTLFTGANVQFGLSELQGHVFAADAADPVRNTAYVYDQTTQKIIAINTNDGNTVALGTTTANVVGLAVSVDDTRLFASEPGATQIEVFNLPRLTLLKTLNVGVAVQQIVAAANNRIIGDTGHITGFNADSGATLYSMNGDYDGLLRSNVSGTRLYSRARGLSGNDGSIRAWDISGTGNPVAQTSIPGPTGANSTDFAVDTTANHAYFGDGGAQGVEVTLLNNGNQTLWNLTGGSAVENVGALPGVSNVYATAFNGDLAVFDQNGVETASYNFPGVVPTAETMIVTPNGNALSLVSDGVVAIGFSASLAESVQPEASITTLTASATSAPVGGSITFTVNVAPSQAGGDTPTGNITLQATAQPPQIVPLLNGSGQVTLTPPAGTYVVSATYGGDGTYASSTATPITVVISAGTPTTIALTLVNPASAPLGNTFTFGGTVTATGSSGAVPTGTVTFYDGAISLGTTPVQTNGLFNFSTSALTVGTDIISASYSGDTTYAGSVTTAAVTVTPAVGTNDSITALASVTPNPSTIGDMLVFRGSVESTSGTGPAPTGLVSLFNGDVQIGSAALLSDGTFTFTFASLPAGVDALSAGYAGDSMYAGSSSSAFSETVTSNVVPTFGPAVLPASLVGSGKLNARLPLTIMNTSTDLKGKFTINLYADTSPALDGTQTLLQSLSKSFLLKNGKSKAITLKPKSLPASLTDGTYYVLAEVVDPTGTSTVTALPSTVQVAAPFVALSAAVGPVAPATLVAGKTASVFVTVTNTGNTLATGSLAVTLNASAGGVKLGSVTRSVKIKPGKPTKVKVRFTYNGSLPSGTYFPQAAVTLGSVTTTATATDAVTV